MNLLDEPNYVLSLQILDFVNFSDVLIVKILNVTKIFCLLPS